MTEPQDIHHLAAAYALDALEPDERAAFEAHYPACETCAVEVAEFGLVATSLAESVQVEPPAELKQSIMSQVARTRQEPPAVDARPSADRFASASRWMLAAAAALVLVAGIAIVGLRGDERSVDEVVGAADAVPLTLDALTDDHQGTLRVVWSDELDQVAVIGNGLVDPGAGMTYALWFVQGEGVVPAALFTSESGDVADVLDVDDTQVDGWGITIEPAGGSDQPTGPVIYAGSF